MLSEVGMNNRFCMILNGPPGSGKDTLADELTKFGFTKHQFKESLYQATAGYYQHEVDDVRHLFTSRDLKEVPCTEFDGKSPRDALIHVSEDVYKVQYGKDYFGRAAAHECRNAGTEYAVFSDGGFYEEMIPLKEVFDTLVVVRLHRLGFTFDGDSRNYLEKGVPQNCLHDVTLYEGDIQDAVRQLLAIVEHQLLPWKPTDKLMAAAYHA